MSIDFFRAEILTQNLLKTEDRLRYLVLKEFTNSSNIFAPDLFYQLLINVFLLSNIKLESLTLISFSGMLRRVLCQKFTDVSKVFGSLIIRAESSFEKFVNIYQITRLNSTEGNHLHLILFSFHLLEACSCLFPSSVQ